MSSEATPLVAGDILIVDDTPNNLRLLSELLKKHHYRLRKAITGELALETARLCPPDLILLDIMMPGLDGYEVCRQLKADARTQQIPIIFLSARDSGLDKVTAFELGGADYISKPFQAVEVVARVEHQLQLSRLQKQLQDRNLQLQVQNVRLQQEIHDRLAAETSLQRLNQALEAKVEERTQQLQVALTREQQLNELQSKLLAAISHEFRTPLSVIVLATELLRRRLGEALEPQCGKQLQKIDHSVQRLAQMLDNTTLLTLIDAQTLNFQPEAVDLVAYCTQWVEKQRHCLGEGHTLQLAIDPLAIVIAADLALLQQLLTNLLCNAVCYSPTGGNILLRVSRQDQEAVLQVQDSGIGIPTYEQAQIFERFYRASNADSIPGTPGTGLGLAVVQEIVRLHRGRIALDSDRARGTVITLYLPLHPDLAA